jgi:hypothetical protein
MMKGTGGCDSQNNEFAWLYDEDASRYQSKGNDKHDE